MGAGDYLGMAQLKNKWVLLDTNMVLVPAQFKIDVYDEIKRMHPDYRIGILRGTVEELEILATRNNTLAKEVKLAKDIMRKEKIEILESQGPVDDALIQKGKTGMIIATNDKELRKKLQKEGVKTIYLRNKERIVESGGSL